MSVVLGKNTSNSKRPLHLDKLNHLLVNDDTNKEVLDKIEINTKPIYKEKKPTNKVSINSSSGIAVYADTSPAPTLDIDNNRPGWLHKKLTGAEKFNYYFYSQGSKVKTLKDLTSVCANVRLDTWDNSASCPFLVVYTKATGVSDAGSWYHSKIAYACDAEIDITLGEHIELWAKSIPSVDSGLRKIQLSNVVTTGEALDSEDILTISLHSDSGSLANTQSMVSSLGWEINDTKMRLELT